MCFAALPVARVLAAGAATDRFQQHGAFTESAGFHAIFLQTASACIPETQLKTIVQGLFCKLGQVCFLHSCYVEPSKVEYVRTVSHSSLVSASTAETNRRQGIGLGKVETAAPGDGSPGANAPHR